MSDVKYTAYLVHAYDDNSRLTEESGAIDINDSEAGIQVTEGSVVVTHAWGEISVFPMHNLRAFFSYKGDL